MHNHRPDFGPTDLFYMLGSLRMMLWGLVIGTGLAFIFADDAAFKIVVFPLLFCFLWRMTGTLFVLAGLILAFVFDPSYRSYAVEQIKHTWNGTTPK